MVELLRNFFGGAACGAAIPLIFAFWQNIYAIKEESKPKTKEVLMKVIIGFLFGGAMAAALFTNV